MGGFVTRNRGGLLLGGALLAAWVVALLSTCGHRSSEPENRWVDGPASFANPVLPADPSDS